MNNFKNYTWLIPVQAAATAADLVYCGSFSGRSLVIPGIILIIYFVKIIDDKFRGD